VAGDDGIPRESLEDSARDTAHAGPFDGLNAWLLTSVDEHIARIPGAEAQQTFLDGLAKRLPKLFSDRAGQVVDSLFESASAMLADYRALDASHAAEVEKCWGEALDIYRMLWVSCHEAIGL